MVKHPNESRFEFALRLTKALKDKEINIIDGADYFSTHLDSKTMLDILYKEIMNPVDPLRTVNPYADKPDAEIELYGWGAGDMEEEFHEFSPGVMEEAAPKVDQSLVDALKNQFEAFKSLTVLKPDQSTEVVSGFYYDPMKLGLPPRDWRKHG